MRLVLVSLGIASTACSAFAMHVAAELHNGVFFALAVGLAVAAVRKTILVYRNF